MKTSELITQFHPVDFTDVRVSALDSPRMESLDIHYLCDHRDTIPTLARWYHEQWAFVSPVLSVEDAIRRFESRAYRGQIPAAFVALVDGHAVGLACLVEHDMDSSSDLSPWLASVLVAPEFRGRGIGTALSERATQEASRLGHDGLFLVTFDQVPFYARLGWSILEETTHVGRPATIMTKELTVRKGRKP